VLIELAASDGIKLIGQCPDLTALRTIEPTASNQRISVASYSPGWAGLIGAPVGGGEFYYDLMTQHPPTMIFLYLLLLAVSAGSVLARVKNIGMEGSTTG
jgi:hypothetical protein